MAATRCDWFKSDVTGWPWCHRNVLLSVGLVKREIKSKSVESQFNALAHMKAEINTKKKTTNINSRARISEKSVLYIRVFTDHEQQYETAAQHIQFLSNKKMYI